MAEYNISASEDPLQILSLDTSSRAGSVAVMQHGRIIADITGEASITHGQRLPGDLMRALDQAGVRLEDVELLAVAAGPGSFTGLRIGIAAMQGLAFARALKIVPVSTLDALAHQIRRDANQGLIAPWLDAQRGEVFAGLYAAGLEVMLSPPSAASPEATLRQWRGLLPPDQPVTFAGDGAVRYKDAIEAALGDRATVLPDVPSLASAVARMAASHPERALLPHAVIPIYIRRPDVELARERSATRS